MFTRFVFITYFCVSSVFTYAQTWGDGNKKHDVVFASAESAPKYPGGLSAFYQFVAENLKAPEKSMAKVAGKSLLLNIIIDHTGTPVYAEIEKGINKDCNNAALSIVSKMPKWTPALQNGKPVSAWIKIPLIYID